MITMFSRKSGSNEVPALPVKMFPHRSLFSISYLGKPLPFFGGDNATEE